MVRLGFKKFEINPLIERIKIAYRGLHDIFGPEAGKKLDEKYSALVKDDHTCCFPGCWNFTEWFYLDNGLLVPVKKEHSYRLFSKDDLLKLIFIIRHPILEIRSGIENDKQRDRIILGVCDRHLAFKNDLLNCSWTAQTLEKRKK